MLLAKLSKQLRRKRSCFRPKKKRQPSAIASAGAVPSQGLLCCHGSDFGASGTDDLVGGSENLLGALFGYCFGIKTVPSAQPVLNVTSAKLGSLKPQRFAAKKRHGFRFDFSQIARRGFSVREISLACVQQNVSAFVEKCLLKKLRKRIDSELSATGESLHISVRVIEWNALNIQGAKRSLGIPLRDRNWFKFLPVSLA